MNIKIIARNKRASYDYFLQDKIEVGLVLQGTEVKSLRLGKVSIARAYISINEQNEAWIHNMDIPHYEFGNIHNHETDRKRKLLMHKKEIVQYQHQLKAGNFTLIPCSLYFKKGRVKLEIALGRGKKKHDKRQDQAKKEVERRLRRGDYS